MCARSETGRRPRQAVTILLSGVLGLGLMTGCTTFSGDSVLIRDINDIKLRLDESLKQQDSMQRTVNYSLSEIGTSLQGHEETNRAALTDMERRMREQLEEIRQLRQRIEELNFTVDRLTTRLGGTGSGTTGLGSTTTPGISGSSTSYNPGTGVDFGSATPATGTPTTDPVGTPAAGSLEQLVAEGQRQFNLENYGAAQLAFSRALAMNPTGQQRVDVLYWLAESNHQLGNLNEAEQYYRQLIQESATDPKAWASLEQLSRISLANNDKDYAMVLLRYIIENNPNYQNIERVRQSLQALEAQ